MNKKLIFLPLVSFGLLISCNNGSSNDSTLSNISSEMTSVSESVTPNSDDEISSVTNGTSSVELSSEVSSEKLSVKEQLLKYLDDCVNNNNYTIVNDESTSYYVSNAFFTVDSYDTPHGYAEDENGIFSYTISNEIVESITYVKNDDNEDENAKNLYKYSTGSYSWYDKTSYLFNSFANISLENLELKRVKNSKVESYTVPFETFSSLMIENHLQSFLTAKYIGNGETEKSLSGTCTLSLIEGGFNVSFKNPSTFTTLNYIVSSVGTTEIPVIENYIKSGGVQVENLYTRVVSLFTSSNYKVTFSDGVVRYVASNYVVEVNGDTTFGYFVSSKDNLIYRFDVVNDGIVAQLEPAELSSLSKYFVNSYFLHGFTLKDDKLILDDYVTLSGFAGYFSAGEIENDNYIGYAEITAELDLNNEQKLNADKCRVTFNGREYDKNEGVLLNNYYSAVYSDFNSTSFELLDNYLKTI